MKSYISIFHPFFKSGELKGVVVKIRLEVALDKGLRGGRSWN
jgi:hypothetical protein